MKRNKAHGRTDRGSNWSKMPTARIEAILNDPYLRGTDGADYYQYKEELESELWQRQLKRAEEQLAQYERDQKTYQKYLATAHKREKAS